MIGGDANGYGAWPVVLTELNTDSIIYAAGIGTDISFDVEIMEHTGASVHAFDPTPGSLEWLRKQMVPKNFHVHPWGLANYDGEASFYLPENASYISHSIVYGEEIGRKSIKVPVKRIKSIMKELGHDHIDLLKIDIEGAEYEVIDDLIKSEVHVKQFLVEFHHRMHREALEKARQSFFSLHKAGYKIFAISARGEEYGFIRSID